MAQAKAIDSSHKGYIYVARNDTANVTKIGITTVSPEERVCRLHRSYDAPGHWRVYCAYKVNNFRQVETLAHRQLASELEPCYGSREMFTVSPETANIVVCNAIFKVTNIRPVSGHCTYEWIDKNRKNVTSRIERARNDFKKHEDYYNSLRSELKDLQEPYEYSRFAIFYTPLISGVWIFIETGELVGAFMAGAIFIPIGAVIDKCLEKRILRHREERKIEIASAGKNMKLAKYNVMNELQLQKDLNSL